MEMTKDTTKLEIIWSSSLLIRGFTGIPNLLVRHYRELGIQHGEFGFLANLLSYKHDHNDPYPSQDTLAANMNCTTRQIRKWIDSLTKKALLITNKVYNPSTLKDRTVYNFQPLINKLLQLTTGEANSQIVQPHSVVTPASGGEQGNNEGPDVPLDEGPQVPNDQEPKVPTNRALLLDFDKKIDDDARMRDKINHLIFDENKKNISPEQFAIVLQRVCNQPYENIHHYENYLRTSVANEIKINARKSVQMARQQMAAASEKRHSKSNRKSPSQKPIIPVIVDQTADEVDPALLEELLQLAERLESAKKGPSSIRVGA
ncbi:helix-turn-helix domain-containing protein [Paenibacillus polymyxa]|uniref:helix-turn-helix domain-containing protein n=1 Tax=Paenibacillus polymyxa TaxID=1406 RepID=UPI0025B65592|nr:helix-turn-helix domain-containing protein [Paenibacillus polymyxa]MDN4090983.1 helix-turn-helix domain-containing protein [Paenibacillus polymyxa]